MDVEKEEDGKKKTIVEETLNSRKAIWLRPQVGGHAGGVRRVLQADRQRLRRSRPSVIHYTAEGANEFRVLLFIPAHRPFELQWGDFKAGLQLYIQRVLIMDHCEELLPPYLRFVTRRGRFVRPAAEHLARTAAAEPAAGADRKNNVVRTVLNDLEDMKNARVRQIRRASSRNWARSSRRASAATGPTARSWPTCCCSSR